MIAYSEGTSGPNGYRTMFGGGLAANLDDHPRQMFSFTNKNGQNLKTTAAGRYQFLSRTWDELAKSLALPDFGPASQDAAALELIRRRGALKDVDAGRITAAIAKCAPIWASMPGAGYAQPERKLNTLLASFTAAGGNLEA
jgi:lysozyme